MGALEQRVSEIGDQQQRVALSSKAVQGGEAASSTKRVERADAILAGRVGYLEGVMGDAVGSYASLDDRFLATETAQAHLEDKLINVDGHVTAVQRAMAKLRL